jgi:hypothetical protein
MSRRGSLVILLTLAGYILVGNHGGRHVDNAPIGTYVMGISDSSTILMFINVESLHSVGFSRQDINHHLFVLCLPPSISSIPANDRLDIVVDILDLSALVM